MTGYSFSFLNSSQKGNAAVSKQACFYTYEVRLIFRFSCVILVELRLLGTILLWECFGSQSEGHFGSSETFEPGMETLRYFYSKVKPVRSEKALSCLRPSERGVFRTFALALLLMTARFFAEKCIDA